MSVKKIKLKLLNMRIIIKAKLIKNEKDILIDFNTTNHE